MKRSVCIISCCPIARDPRVLRQIECLAPRYAVTAVGSSIRLVHHVTAFRDRCLEKMILALAASDPRISLDFILVPRHSGYIEELEARARQVAPERVVFHPPVPPEQTAPGVAQYAMGFYLLAPSNYNHLIAAPKRFFDYIAAGMPVYIGPSPAMTDIVEGDGLGCVAPSFDPQEVAATLNAVDAPQLAAMQHGARPAAERFHADAEMARVVPRYRAALPEDPSEAGIPSDDVQAGRRSSPVRPG